MIVKSKPQEIGYVDKERRGTWNFDRVRYCECCGLQWEDDQESEPCPMAELEAAFCPYMIEMMEVPQSPTRRVRILSN